LLLGVSRRGTELSEGGQILELLHVVQGALKRGTEERDKENYTSVKKS